MTRRQLRENVFKMLFRVEFHDEKEMPEQLALFEDEVEPIREDEKIYISLIESKIIDETVEKNPGMKEQDIAGAAVKISKNYPLDLYSLGLNY